MVVTACCCAGSAAIQAGREIIIIDNSYRGPRGIGGFYVDLPPPMIRIPYDRYIVDAE